MKLAEIPELKGVSPAEKVELIDELWASMPRESFPAPESHLTELHRRVAAVQEDLSRALIPRKPVKRFAPRRGYDEATQLGNPGGGPDDAFQARWSCAGSWHFSASRQMDWGHSSPPEPRTPSELSQHLDGQKRSRSRDFGDPACCATSTTFDVRRIAAGEL
jgi:putative addiction module component (TIGR02574 family)